jgi:hypothetical protein
VGETGRGGTGRGAGEREGIEKLPVRKYNMKWLLIFKFGLIIGHGSWDGMTWQGLALVEVRCYLHACSYVNELICIIWSNVTFGSSS